jgi:formyltetrahydrofolate deformylase
MKNTTARILITCPDRPGIVAAVTNFLYSHGVNITTLDQHSTDPEGGVFFMRLEFQTPHMDISRPALEKAFEEVLAERFRMDWRISYAAEKKRMAVLVSRHDHAMIEILWRWSRGELDCEIATVISNHPDLRQAVEGFGVDFVHIPVTRETREQGEQEMLALLEGRADLIVLARYMQILSPGFVSRYPNQIINIHHSFLPAFIGADPYRQAYQRGVKIIGATAHYVTADLDEGPIIEQDVTRVSHRFSVPDLKDAGRDLERQVLARAVRYHLEDRIIVYNNTTFVFATR